jgi:hypothetical protein
MEAIHRYKWCVIGKRLTLWLVGLNCNLAFASLSFQLLIIYREISKFNWRQAISFPFNAIIINLMIKSVYWHWKVSCKHFYHCLLHPKTYVHPRTAILVIKNCNKILTDFQLRKCKNFFWMHFLKNVLVMWHTNAKH